MSAARLLNNTEDQLYLLLALLEELTLGGYNRLVTELEDKECIQQNKFKMDQRETGYENVMWMDQN